MPHNGYMSNNKPRTANRKPRAMRNSDWRTATGRVGFRECRECFGVGFHKPGCPKSE